MNLKKKENILLFFLIFFSIYCAINIGQSWDEGYHLLQGKITLDYLLTFGEIDKDLFYREYYSPSFWTLKYFVIEFFPKKYEIEISHLINLSVSILTVFGIGKLCKELFNKQVGKIVFLVLFFYPIFFGHMGFNSKDTILAFSHVWTFYYLIKYLKFQNLSDKINKYIYYIAILTAIASGIQIVFFGALLPIIIFLLLDIFLFKKIINKYFDLKKFFFDIFKCFIAFYLFMIIFWIDVHPNILFLPIKFFAELFSESWNTGWPFNLVSGNYYFSREVPKNYLFLNLLYKSPEYILFLYFVFIIFFIKFIKFFKNEFENFNYKIISLVGLIIFPNLLLYFLPFPIYDGIRLFIWILPYFCIIPGLVIYFLLKNIKLFISKSIIFITIIFSIYYLYDFLRITPYHYTYLNIINGQKENRYKKFESDYWGVSLKELVENFNINNKDTISISTCGISDALIKEYLKEKGYNNLKFVSSKEASYIIMTNKTTSKTQNIVSVNDITNCFDKYPGKNISMVKRNGQILSVLRKIN